MSDVDTLLRAGLTRVSVSHSGDRAAELISEIAQLFGSQC